MSEFKKISDDLSVAGQISDEQIPELAAAGFKSVLNLRSPEEQGFCRMKKNKQKLRVWNMQMYR
ncbi:beta-lactamase hydrolase domain-containing protein [Richelia sinica]|uniref:beta-lactamase hydrolase domain-containing protein n=1 Tax=Richelia sinica TaxID=1357545 RepID=UPI00202B86CD|nr:sulfur transferase domain-containing protein [Richelia sinica]